MVLTGITQASSSSQRVAREAGRIPELDGVRGLAILLVLTWHYGASIAKPQPGSSSSYLVHLFGMGWSGVDLFFVLSGFLIGGILLDQKQSANYFRVFYVRRACRILPLYLLWLLPFAVIALLAPPASTPATAHWLFANPLPLLSYATFTQNLAMADSGSLGPNWMAITWSVAIEEQFYLVLPLVIRLVPNRLLPWALGSLAMLAPLSRLALFYSHPNAGIATYVLTPCRGDALFLGVLGAYAVRHPGLLRLLTRHTRVLYLLLGTLLTTVAVLAVTGQMLVSFGRTVFGYSTLALLYLCFLLLAVTERRGLVSVIVRNRALRKLGLIAYGVYLIHQAVLGLTHRAILDQLPRIGTLTDAWVTLLALVATLALATASWHFLERRFVALGHASKYRPRDSSASSPPGVDQSSADDRDVSPRLSSTA